MKVFAIAALNLRRIARDRIALFFIVALPMLIIFLIGIAVFGATGTRGRVGLLDQGSGPLGRELASRLEHDKSLFVTAYHDLGQLQKDLRRETVSAGVVLPKNYDADLRAGRPVQIAFLAPAVDPGPGIRSAVSLFAAEQGAQVRAAAFASSFGGGSFDANLERAKKLSAQPGGAKVTTETVGTNKHALIPSGFRYPAASNLILFVFITSMAGSAQLIETRQLGISRRMLGTPTSSRSILGGMALGRFMVAAFQGLFIFTVGTLVFGVKWGDLWGTAALVLVFCLVGTSVGMLSGTLFRTPEQAGSVGPPIGIALGMLGGCMWPLEIVGPAMRTVGHITPHAWAMDSFVDLLSKGQKLADIAPNLLILLGYAAVLLPLAAWRLRRSLTT
jgi:ABC-2 type transport system permease protein